ncbi:diguanylate cyclase (GGDEF)-like protein [Actinoplanes xinjiangensis]|uniref:Diguanylate cyclase (GGDEF)-like protein n=1 Tax=Actinoplanes xinjiangensis TaxID=512350 RepID=A0A316EX20_9ACTN|nr:diguanylate cyclase (GGDEF)-like protein [Actinoplanes xinjiangensis]GIF45185.1 hypothetical protein Axi01nite_94960 [Actinoplanes xinjiangensis]
MVARRCEPSYPNDLTWPGFRKAAIQETIATGTREQTPIADDLVAGPGLDLYALIAGGVDHLLAGGCHIKPKLLESDVPSDRRARGRTSGVVTSAPADVVALPCPPGFTLLGELGRGRQGVVHRIRRGAQQYAMKLFHPGTGSVTAVRREAAKLATVRDAGVPRIHEVGTVGDRVYLVMELVEGRSLKTAWRAGPMAPDALLRVAIDVASALRAVHAADLVHGDLQPDNVLLGHDGSVRLIDFSLGAHLVADGTDRMVGTALYSSPEQSGMLHRPVDGRADLYSLGVLLFEAATGTPPFTAPDLGELLRMHAVAPVPDLAKVAPGLPAALAGVIERLLVKDPDDRYQSATAVLAELRRMTVGAGNLMIAGTASPEQDGDRVPLVGRDAELEVLQTGWAEARTGRGSLIMVTGESGSGKSRLVRELAGGVPAGCPKLYGAASRGQRQPLAPLRAAVDGYVRELSVLPPGEAEDAFLTVRAAAQDTAGVIGHLTDSLAGILGTPSDIGHLDEERYTAALAGFLLELARRTGGLLLHLDDLQWFDRSTVRVLEHLAVAADHAPLLVVLTARADEMDVSPAAAVTTVPADRLTTLELPPLAAATTAELVTAINGELAVSGDLAARLTARSRGNPFIIAEYVRALIDAGLVTVSWGEWRVETAALDVLTLPQHVADLVRRRVEDLDTRSRRLLGIAAILGYRFRAELLTSLGGLPQRTVAILLADAARLALVERHGEGDYGFLHERIRAALVDQFDDVTRRRIHDDVADLLSRRTTTEPAAVYALAHHRMAGTPGHDPAGAVAACRAAGVLALAEQAPETAVTFLEYAARTADDGAVALDDSFGELLATAYHRAARLDDAVAAFQDTLRRATDPLRRARLLYLLSTVYESAWNSAGQISAGEQALTELGRTLPRGNAARLAAALGYFLLGWIVWITRVGRGSRVPRVRERYLLQCSIGESLGSAYIRQLQPAKSVIFALRAPYFTQRAGRSAETLRAMSSVALLLEFSGFTRLADRLSAAVRRGAADLDDKPLKARLAWSRAIARHGSGNDDGTEVQRVLDEHDHWLDIGLALDAYAVLSWDWLLRGDMAVAESGLDRARRRAASGGMSGRSAVVAADACLLALRGRAGEAALLLHSIDGDEIPLHQWLDLLIGRLQTAVEREDFGEDYERDLAAFDAFGLKPGDVLPAQHTFYCLRAYAELARCRTATQEFRPARLAAARAAVEVLGKVANRRILRAYHHVGLAALAVLAGTPDKALEQLTAAAPALRAVDAPLLEFEVARIQAYALNALRLPRHARRQAAVAQSLAHAQGWPHRAHRLAVEFDLDDRDGPVAATGLDRGREGQRWAALQQVSLAASRVLDPAQLARIALDETLRLLGAERAILLLESDVAPELGHHVGRDTTGQDVMDLSGYSRSIVERVRTERRALVVTGTEHGEVLQSDSMVEYGLRSILAGPVLLDDRLLGVIYLDSRLAKGVFTTADLEILTAVTHQIAISLETARAAQLEVAVATAHQQRDLAEMLRDAMATFAGTLDPEQVLSRLTTAMRQAGTAQHICLVTVTDEPGTVAVRYDHDDEDVGRLLVHGVPAEMSALLQCAGPVPPAGSAAELGLTRVLQALPDDAVTTLHAGWRLIPMATREGRLGVVVLGGAAPTDQASDSQVIAALVGQAMTAYDNARLFAQVHHLATVDSLTGAANRRSFFERAEQEIAALGDCADGIAVLMLDVDHFKKINDRYGHQIGDEVLRGVVARLRTGCDRDDVVARYGGEEFVILLRDRECRAAAVAERIRAEICRAPIETKAGPVQVTVSVGAARAAGSADIDALLARADACLYEAKRAGRDRVVIDISEEP